MIEKASEDHSDCGTIGADSDGCMGTTESMKIWTIINVAGMLKYRSLSRPILR